MELVAPLVEVEVLVVEVRRVVRVLLLAVVHALAHQATTITCYYSLLSVVAVPVELAQGLAAHLPPCFTSHRFSH